MSQDVYNFAFDDSVSMLDATSTLLLALVAVESLHGSVAVRLQCRFHCDAKRRMLHIHTSTDIGNQLARIFSGFAFRSYGDSVRVRRGYADSGSYRFRKGCGKPEASRLEAIQ